MTEDSGTPDYAVGYRRPPVAGQFKPGRSGNPKGRPKGRKTMETILRDALEQPMTVTVNGKPKRMPCGQIGIERAVLEFAKGDAKVRAFLLALLRLFPGAVGEQADSDPSQSISDVDTAAVTDYLRRLGVKS